MTHESRPKPISESELSFRNTARTVLNPIFRGEVASETLPGLNALAELRDHTGRGAIFYANHIDKVDPLVAMLQIVNNHEDLQDAEIVTPLAHHQRMDGIHLIDLSRRAGVNPMTIVTENSHERYEKKLAKTSRARRILQTMGPIVPPPNYEEFLRSQIPQVGTGGIEFAQKATDSLSSGGLVYLPAQAERSSMLRLPDENITDYPDEHRKERPLGLLVSALEREGLPLDEIGLIFVGFSFAGDPNYGKRRGFNFGKKHIVRFGEFTTIRDAVDAANGKKRLDEWAILNGIAPIVDRNYLSPQLRRKYEVAVIERYSQEESISQ